MLVVAGTVWLPPRVGDLHPACVAVSGTAVVHAHHLVVDLAALAGGPSGALLLLPLAAQLDAPVVLVVLQVAVPDDPVLLQRLRTVSVIVVVDAAVTDSNLGSNNPGTILAR